MGRARSLGSLLALGCAVSCVLPGVLACEGRTRSTEADRGGAHAESHSGPAIAVFDLTAGIPEQPPTGFLGLSSKGPSFDELVHEVEHLGRDKDVRGVLVRLGTARVGLAQAVEIGAMLEAVGAKLPVYCHADELGNATLALAARACKEVWLSPAGSVDAIGIAAQLVFFHKLLADELGLDVDFLQVGKYKGAEEPFTRDGPSPEARASLESTLAGIRASWIEGLHKGRPAAPEGAVEDGPYAPAAARERGLIDQVGYFDEARKALEKASGAVRAEVRLGPGQAAGGDGLPDVLRVLTGESLGGAPVALVRAVGAISMEGGGGPLAESGGIVERRLVRTLTRLEKDESVKAVVLRIDSPGGSALASDLLWHALMGIRSKKPLVVSVGGMAASGGYYLASTGAVLFADETSIVGSVGVVGGKIAAERALAKIGVHAETIPAKAGDPAAASRAAYESLLEPWDGPTRVRLLQTMTAIYDLFLARVAEGRHLPVDRVAESAEGRIFGGRDAVARGLVDEIGGLTEAIARARTMASLPADARVGVAGESAGFLEALTDDEPRTAATPSDDAPSAALGGIAAGLARRVEPALGPFLASLAPLSAHEAALCALPFALTVQ
jgi:protease-4